jgi:hypothetical protein
MLKKIIQNRKEETMYRMIIRTTDNNEHKITFDKIHDARELAIKTFEEETTKSIVIASKKTGKVKWYQNKSRPMEVWIN